MKVEKRQARDFVRDPSPLTAFEAQDDRGKKMIWANFLHFYQPPTQKRYWVDRITDEAYRRILRELEKAPNARVTMNIAAVLVELWDKWGHQDVIDGYRKLLEKGQIELTGSAKYHPLLPRIPEEEMIRQIKLNEVTLEKYFGVRGPGSQKSKVKSQKSRVSNQKTLRGFFPPEMAYDRNVAEAVAELGYEWIIAEELSFSREFNKVDYTKIYKVSPPRHSEPRVKSRGEESPPIPRGSFANAQDDNGEERLLTIYFRQRDISYKILSGQLGTANLFLQELGDRITQDNYLLTAMDGETFGHHRPGMEKLLFELYKTPDLKTCLISELPQHFKETKVAETRPSTWALMEKDIEKNVPFARWEDPGNKIHEMQWELTNLAIEAVNKSVHKPDKPEGLRIPNPSGLEKQWLKAREMLDRAVHSDQYWWACARPWWSLEMIERGAKELMDTVLTVPDAPKRATLDAKRLYFDIITTGFEWQRTGKVEEMSHKEDEEIRMRTDEGLPKLPKEELEKMIANIRREMEECAEKEEYERAAQLRDRIRELQEYAKEK